MIYYEGKRDFHKLLQDISSTDRILSPYILDFVRQTNMLSIWYITSSVLRSGLLSAQERKFSPLSRKNRLISLRSEAARARIVHKGALSSIELEVVIGQHQQVPVPTGTCGMPQLTVSKTRSCLVPLKNASTRHLTRTTR